jgi:polyribonucleotide nucleotidyltransferase
VPFDGPIAGIRIGRIGGEFKGFLSPEEREQSPLDLVVACKDGKVVMVEAGANEVPEDTIIEAMHWAVSEVQPALDLQRQLAKLVNTPKQEYELVLPSDEVVEEVAKWTDGKFGSKIRGNVMERAHLLDDMKYAMHDEFALSKGQGETDNEKVKWYDENLRDVYDQAFELAVHKEVRRGILEEGVRPDGRKLTEVRPLSSQVGILPRVHGSSLFTRGVTQAMNIVTLAPLSYAQDVDTMEVTDGKRRYMHHYNAPSYTVGEPGRLGSPGRREIGHGYLAERALLPVLPSEEDFPYAIRSVTEIMSQNGSTSMAATCSSCMALMDAGVPLNVQCLV